MRLRPVSAGVLFGGFLLFLSYPALAQTICTGTCYERFPCPYCGFTAFRRGGICVEITGADGSCGCEVYACGSNASLMPWEQRPLTPAGESSSSVVRLAVISAKHLEPRT